MSKLEKFEEMIKTFGFVLEIINYAEKYDVYFVEQMNPISSDNIKKHDDAYLMRCTYRHWVEQEENIYA